MVNYLSNLSRLLLGTEPAHNTSPRPPKTSKASLRKELLFLFLLPPPPSPSWALPLPRVLSVAIPKASSFLSWVAPSSQLKNEDSNLPVLRTVHEGRAHVHSSGRAAWHSGDAAWSTAWEPSPKPSTATVQHTDGAVLCAQEVYSLVDETRLERSRTLYNASVVFYVEVTVCMSRMLRRQEVQWSRKNLGSVLARKGRRELGLKRWVISRFLNV